MTADASAAMVLGCLCIVACSASIVVDARRAFRGRRYAAGIVNLILAGGANVAACRIAVFVLQWWCS